MNAKMDAAGGARCGAGAGGSAIKDQSLQGARKHNAPRFKIVIRNMAARNIQVAWRRDLRVEGCRVKKWLKFNGKS